MKILSSLMVKKEEEEDEEKERLPEVTLEGL